MLRDREEYMLASLIPKKKNNPNGNDKISRCEKL